MKLTSIFSMTLLAGIGLFAQNTGKMGSTADKMGSKAGSMGSMASGKVSSKDQKFAMNAAAGGMAEVQMGQLAQKNGESQKVKDFGQKLVDDHTKANDELKTIASQKSINLPTSVTPKDQAEMDKLSKLTGASFDKAFMAAMVKDHNKDIGEFQQESNSGQDSDLKSFAAKQLPILQSHLDMAKGGASSSSH